jgi:hypothetical protein
MAEGPGRAYLEASFQRLCQALNRNPRYDTHHETRCPFHHRSPVRDRRHRLRAATRPAHLVCKVCDTVTVIDVTSKEEAMKLCTEGEMVECGSCDKKFKVVAHGPRGKGGQHTETRIVNDKGEECMFVTKLSE